MPDGRLTRRAGRFELSLEPNANPAGKTFQEAMFRQGIPICAFEVDNLQKELND